MSETAQVEDFRRDRSATREGGGWAKSRREDAVSRLVDHGILPRPVKALPPMLIDPSAGTLDFWLLWHLHGGFDGLVRVGMSEATVYRKVKAFRQAYGIHPDEYRMPGVTVDVEAFIEEFAHDVRDDMIEDDRPGE